MRTATQGQLAAQEMNSLQQRYLQCLIALRRLEVTSRSRLIALLR
jgi:hypothetical protein